MFSSVPRASSHIRTQYGFVRLEIPFRRYSGTHPPERCSASASDRSAPHVKTAILDHLSFGDVLVNTVLIRSWKVFFSDPAVSSVSLEKPLVPAATGRQCGLPVAWSTSHHLVAYIWVHQLPRLRRTVCFAVMTEYQEACLLCIAGSCACKHEEAAAGVR